MVYLLKYFQIFIYFISQDRKSIGSATITLRLPWAAPFLPSAQEHPAQPQDINPIKGVLMVLKIRVNARPNHSRNPDQLWDLLHEEWKKIDIDLINGQLPACLIGLRQSIGPREGLQSIEITPNALDLML
jgi:hypothetical protein